MLGSFLVKLQEKWETLCAWNSSPSSLVSAEETLAMSTVTAAQDYVHTFLQSLKKFFLKISFVVYSWSSIFAKNVATSSALVLSFMTLPTKKGFLLIKKMVNRNQSHKQNTVITLKDCIFTTEKFVLKHYIIQQLGWTKETEKCNCLTSTTNVLKKKNFLRNLNIK